MADLISMLTTSKGGLFGSDVVFLTSTGTWTVPSGWSIIKVEAIGSGGGSSGGPGGGGGAYAVTNTLSVTAGQTVYVQTGAPPTGVGIDSWLNKTANSAPTSTADGVLAKGGGNAVTGGGAGGSSASCIGNLAYSGGDGGAYVAPSRGGGGGAAGPNGAGGHGADGVSGLDGGAGGGGANGGGNGALPTSADGANGGTNRLGSGAGIGASGSTPATNGTNGGGGGGASGTSGGNGAEGSMEVIWTSTSNTAGPGGGGGSSSTNNATLVSGTGYGGGRGGGGHSGVPQPGIIVVTKLTPTLYSISTTSAGAGGLETTSGVTNSNFGTGNFTYEAWVYPTSLATNWGAVVGHTFAAGGGLLYVKSDGSVDFYEGGSKLNSGAGYISTNQWYHIAVARQSGTLRLFIDGALITSTSYTNSITDTFLYFGQNQNDGEEFNGYIYLPHVIDSAKYTSAFTPSTDYGLIASSLALIEVSSTAFTDLAGNALTNNDASIVEASP